MPLGKPTSEEAPSPAAEEEEEVRTFEKPKITVPILHSNSSRSLLFLGSQFASVRVDHSLPPPSTSTPERRRSSANQFNQDLLKQALATRRFSVAGEEKESREEGKNNRDSDTDSDDWLDADETNGEK